MKLYYDHLRDTDKEYARLLDTLHDEIGKRVYPFGSRYIMGPLYPRGDTDVLLEAVDEFGAPDESTLAVIKGIGFQPHISAGYAGMHIASYRRGDVNLVVLIDQWEFYARCACVELCRTQRVADKETRRSFHQMIADVERVTPFDMADADTFDLI